MVAGVRSGPLWLDEALSVEIAELPLSQLREALRVDGAPPLYYLLLHAWLRVVGDGTVEVRLLTVALVPVALLLARALGRRLGGVSGGRAAVVVLAALPWTMRYGSETRMYLLVVVEVLAGALLVERLLRRRSWPAVAGLAAVTAALLLTHYWSLFLLAVVGLVALLRRWWPVVIGLGAGGLAFLPWLPVFLFQARRTGAPWADPLELPELLRVPRYWGGGDDGGRTVLAVLLVALLVVAAVKVRTARVPVLVAGGTLLLAFAVVFVGGGAFTGRYTAVAVPLVAVAVGLGAAALGPRGSLAALTALVVVGAATGPPSVAVARTSGAGVVQAFVESGGRSGDLLAYCPDQLAPPVQRLLEQAGYDVDQVVYPTLGPPQRVDWVDYEQRQDAADPAAVARAISERAGEQRPVYLLSATEYRTFEGDCEAVREELARLRGPGEHLFGRVGSTGQLLRVYPPLR